VSEFEYLAGGVCVLILCACAAALIFRGLMARVKNFEKDDNGDPK